MPELAYPDPPLRGERLLLRRWRGGDLPALLAGFGAPSVSDFSWPHDRPYTADDGQQFLDEVEPSRRAGEQLAWAVVEPVAPDLLLGGISLYDVGCDCAAVGYWLVPAARGRGIATAAVRLLAGWAGTALGLLRLELTCAPDNDASQRVAERAGFVRRTVRPAHLPFRGGLRDSVVFDLLL